MTFKTCYHFWKSRQKQPITDVLQIAQLFIKADTQVIIVSVWLMTQIMIFWKEKSELRCTSFLQIYDDKDPNVPGKLKFDDKNSVKSLVTGSPILVLLTTVISNYIHMKQWL